MRRLHPSGTSCTFAAAARGSLRPIFSFRNDALLRARHGDELALLAVAAERRADRVRARHRLVRVRKAAVDRGSLLRRELGCSLGRQLGVEEREDDLLADGAPEAPRTPGGLPACTRRAGPSEPWPAGARPRAGGPCSRDARATARVDDLEDHAGARARGVAPFRAAAPSPCTPPGHPR